MKRLELFEFEDFNWLPNFIRSGVTNLIQVLHRMMGTADVLASLISIAQQKHHFESVVDLGSGSGGPMIDSIALINQKSSQPINLLLTDKYPNQKAIESINKQALHHVQYQSESLDALALGTAPKGLKTMIASFHHMNPSTARQILKTAESNKQPILIYEIAVNNIPTLLWWILLPISLVILIIMCLVMTPFVRPFSWRQIFFTYLIPIIPIVYAWDGQASIMRTYTFKDVESLIGGQDDESDYHWEIDHAFTAKDKKAGYYILGYPKA